MASKQFGDNGKHPGAAKRVGASGNYDAQFRGYINLNLSDDQKSQYPKWSASASLYDTFEAVVADGVVMSVKIDPKGGGFLASATQRRESSPNAGLVVTARGQDAVTAWGRLLFCLAILCRSERWEDVQSIAQPDRWS